MENLGTWIQKFPELAPGIVIGALAGIGYGIYKDEKSGEEFSWWQLGGYGAAIGAFVWLGFFGDHS